MTPIKFFLLGIIVIGLVWITEPLKPSMWSFGGSVNVPLAYFIWVLFYLGFGIVMKKLSSIKPTI